MTDRIRVLRVLEYEGPRDWVEKVCLGTRAVKGEMNFVNGAVIRESIIGETPVVLQGVSPEGNSRAMEKKHIYHFSWCSTWLSVSGLKWTCDCGAEPNPK